MAPQPGKEGQQEGERRQCSARQEQGERALPEADEAGPGAEEERCGQESTRAHLRSVASASRSLPTIGAGQTVTLTMTPTVRANIEPGTVVRAVGWFRESGNTGSVLTAASIRVE